MTRVVLFIAGVAILVPMFFVVLGSVLADLGMLVDTFGLWGVPLVFASPVVVWVGGSVMDSRPDRL